MTVSIGTFDDLVGANEPQPIDRNPSIDCAECGDPYNWQDYWKPRIVDGDRVADPNDPDEPWRCDDCHARITTLRRRSENNRKITGWSQ